MPTQSRDVASLGAAHAGTIGVDGATRGLDSALWPSLEATEGEYSGSTAAGAAHVVGILMQQVQRDCQRQLQDEAWRDVWWLKQKNKTLRGL